MAELDLDVDDGAPLRLGGGMNEHSAAFDAQHVLELLRGYRVFVNIDGSRNVTSYAGHAGERDEDM
jgi:hypothetical protein